MSTDPFDYYHEWLAISPAEQPPNHYRLLGIALFESRAEIINRSADDRMAQVRKFQTGKRSFYSQKLLNEIAAARVCLLSADAKRAYDQALTAPVAKNLPTAKAAPVASLVFTPPLYAAPHAPLARPLSPPTPPIAPPILREAKEVVAPPVASPASSDSAESGSPEDLAESSVAKPFSWRRLVIVAFAVTAFAAGGTYFASRYFRGTEVAEAEGNNPDLPPEEPPPVDPVAKAVIIQQEADGSVRFPPTTAVLDGSAELVNLGSENALENFSTAGSSATWRFRLIKPGFFRLEIDYIASDDTTLELLLRSKGEEQFTSIKKVTMPTTSSTKVEGYLLQTAVKRSGEHDLRLQLEVKNGAACSIRKVQLVPLLQ